MTKAGIAARSTGEVDMVVAGPDNALLYYRLTGGQNVPNPLTIAPSGSLSSAPAIVVRSSGEVDVVAKGPYNELLYYWASPRVSWNIATIAPAGSIVSAPAIAVSPAGRVHVVAQGLDGWLLYGTAIPGGPWTVHLVGFPQSIFSAPAIAMGPGGEVCVAAQGPDNGIMYYSLATPGGVWNQEPIAAAFPGATAPAIAIRSNGQVDVVGQGPGSELVLYSLPPGGSWNIPQIIALPGSISSAPAIAVGSSGGVDVVAVVALLPSAVGSGITYYLLLPDGNWKPTTVALLGSSFLTPSIVVQSTGEVDVVVASSQGPLNYYSATPDGQTSLITLSVPVSFSSAPAIAVRSDGEVDTVAQGPNNELLYGTVPFLGNLSSTVIAPVGSVSSAPAIVVRSSGEADVAAQGQHNELLYYWATPGGPWTSQIIAPAQSIQSAPAMAVGFNGLTELVYVVATDLSGGLACYTLLAGGELQNPPNPQAISGPSTSTSAPAIAVAPSGEVYVVTQTPNNELLGYSLPLGGNWDNPQNPQLIAPAGSISSAPAIAVGPGGEVYVAVRGSNNKLLCYVLPPGGKWQNPQTIALGGLTWSVPAIAVRASGEVDVVTQSPDFGLSYYTLPPNGNWNNSQNPDTIALAGETVSAPAMVASSAGFSPANVAVKGPNNEVLYYSRPPGAQWQTAIMTPQPAPAAGLMSNTNYILSSGSSPVAQLTVTINVTQDMVCQLSGGGVDPGDEVLGFAFQLNAYTQAGNKNFQNCAWQQYFFVLNPGNVLVAVVNNYTLKQGPNVLDGFNLVTANGVSLPPFANCAIPAGSQLAITLDFDTAFNVTGASYSFQFEPSGTAYTASCALTSLDLYNTSTQLTSDYIAPIVAFEVNIVGPRNGEYTYLSSGAGTITYLASRGPLLTVLNSEPSNLDYTGAEETSNCAYGPLPAIASSFFIQSFAVRAFPLG